MLRETITDPQEKLRVFSDTDCTTHLRVWYEGSDMSDTETIREFRLVYNALEDTHGIMWRKKSEHGDHEVFAHIGIDDGEDKVLVDMDGESHRFACKQASQPVLNGVFEASDANALADDFMGRTPNMDQGVAQFVYQKLLAFPADQFVSRPHT